MKIRKSILLGMVAFAMGLGFASSTFAMQADPCYKTCMRQFGDKAFCICQCGGTCTPQP